MSSNVDEDVKSLMRDGFILAGTATFQWAGVPSEAQLKKKAQEVGADVVLYNSQYDHTEQGVRPMLGVVPGSSSTTTSSGYGSTYGSATASVQAYGSGGYAYGTGTATGSAYSSYYGSSTTTTDPQFYTYYVPYSQQVNAYSIGFFKKSKPPILGIVSVPLDEATRRNLGRNTGVVVAIVINNSPAFLANILPGDILLEMNGEVIVTPDDLLQKNLANAGSTVKIKLLRDGIETTMNVALRPRPM